MVAEQGPGTTVGMMRELLGRELGQEWFGNGGVASHRGAGREGVGMIAGYVHPGQGELGTGGI